jgi:hypothetical protein
MTYILPIREKQEFFTCFWPGIFSVSPDSGAAFQVAIPSPSRMAEKSQAILGIPLAASCADGRICETISRLSQIIFSKNARV